MEADGDKPVYLTLRAGAGEIFGAGATRARRALRGVGARATPAAPGCSCSSRVLGLRLRCAAALTPRSPRAGCEVAVNQRVALSHQKVALFTWHGATVELEGAPDIACVHARAAPAARPQR